MEKEYLEEVKRYIPVDFDDDDSLIEDEITAAQIYIDECVGVAYKKDENKVRLSLLVLKTLVKFMYENRSIVVPQNLKNNNIVMTIMDVLSNADQ